MMTVPSMYRSRSVTLQSHHSNVSSSLTTGHHSSSSVAQEPRQQLHHAPTQPLQYVQSLISTSDAIVSPATLSGAQASFSAPSPPPARPLVSEGSTWPAGQTEFAPWKSTQPPSLSEHQPLPSSKPSSELRIKPPANAEEVSAPLAPNTSLLLEGPSGSSLASSSAVHNLQSGNPARSDVAVPSVPPAAGGKVTAAAQGPPPALARVTSSRLDSVIGAICPSTADSAHLQRMPLGSGTKGGSSRMTTMASDANSPCASARGSLEASATWRPSDI